MGAKSFGRIPRENESFSFKQVKITLIHLNEKQSFPHNEFHAKAHSRCGASGRIQGLGGDYVGDTNALGRCVHAGAPVASDYEYLSSQKSFSDGCALCSPTH